MSWGMLQQEMWMLEQLGMAYREVRYHKRAIDYFKQQLAISWEINDEAAEI